MNLAKLGYSSWIIILNLILIFVLFIALSYNIRDSFINYPQMIDPKAPIATNPEATNANNNYASILMFIKNNPEKSIKFISDIREKFFNNTCTVKDNIDFNTIATMPNGMPFS